MSVKTSENCSVVDLTYSDLVNSLKQDIKTDGMMPDSVKQSALYLSHMLGTILQPYSG